MNSCSDFYRGEERILQISGFNVLFGRHNIVDSYYFSQYPLCWGWATWRRAWQYYDVDLQAWKANRERYLAKFADCREGAFWATGWDNICSGKLDTWDYQWMMAHFDRNGLSIIPKANLVANIGFGADATHTRSRLAAVRPASGSVRFPLQHPSNVVRNVRADELTARRLFYQRSVLGKATEVVKVQSTRSDVTHAKFSRGLRSLTFKDFELKILVSAWTCNPIQGSESAVGWGWVNALKKSHDIWVMAAPFQQHWIDRAIAEQPAEFEHVRFCYLEPRRFSYESGSRFWKWQAKVPGLEPLSIFITSDGS